MNRMTHRCKNITFPQLHLRSVIIHKYFSTGRRDMRNTIDNMTCPEMSHRMEICMKAKDEDIKLRKKKDTFIRSGIFLCATL